MTGNASRFWSGADTTTATYGQTTGRNAAWVYDAAGNVTGDENRMYKWDAAGRNARAVSTHDASNTLAQGYDGDGQRVRKTETATTTSVTTLYVTSSALGGRVVSELNAAGEKTTTYVYGAGEVIAKQEVAVGGASSVRWVHQDPIVGSRQETSATGATLSRVEVDAQGVDVGLSDPYANQVGGHIQPEIPTLLPYDEINGRFGGGGCTLDGMEIGCGRVAQLLDTGAAVRAPEQTVATVYVRYQSGRTESFSGITTLPSGINVRFTGAHAQAAASRFTVGQILGGFGAGTTGYSRFESGVRGALEFGFASRANRGAEVGRADGSQGWQSVASFLVPPAPQSYNPVNFVLGKHRNFTEEEMGMLEEAEKLISRPECQKWVNEQLDTMGAPAGRNRLDFLVAHADINRYFPNLLATDMGVDDKRNREYKRKYHRGEAYAVTPQVGGNHHIYLYGKAFHRESWFSGKENVDTPGVIVHELFRVAGIDDKAIRKFHTSIDLFDKRITTHCGIKGYIH